ncbi:MAG: hypothetical protein HHJ14_02405, partial [Cellulomonas sp.]|nr:hypothetical protein [Cellulomonas sp.]
RAPRRATTRSTQDDQVTIENRPRGVKVQSAIGGQLSPGVDNVPDKHAFRGSYVGKDVFPMFLDRDASRPNIAPGLLNQLSATYGTDVTAEDLVAYVFALMAHPGYCAKFTIELATPGPRVPVTADPQLFTEAVSLGRRLLWLQTFGERFTGEAQPEAKLPDVPGLGWITAVTAVPESSAAITYDAATRTITIGDGALAGVSPEVWSFSVSGYEVVPRWLAYRTVKGYGRASEASRSTPLDAIRPGVWDDAWNDELLDLVRALTHTVEAQALAASMLDRVVTGPLLSAAALASDKTDEPLTLV